MMYLSWVLLILFLAEIVCLSGKDTYQTSPYCYQKKCPKYKLIYDGSSYDVICYQNEQWVETKTNPESEAYGDISENIKILYRDLYSYVTGKNNQNYKWEERTSPVRIKFTSPSSLNDFTMQFYTPFESGKELPSPENKNIMILTPKEQCFYVRPFRKQDFLKNFNKTILDQLEHLKDRILLEPFPKDLTELFGKIRLAKKTFYINFYARSEDKMESRHYEVLIEYSKK